MNDNTSGTHVDTEALEAERQTEVYPGEPSVDDDGKSEDLGDLKAAIDRSAE